MNEFIDKDRDISKRFFKLHENYSKKNIEETVKQLHRMIEEDPYFFDSYIFLSDIYGFSGFEEKADLLIYEAYANAMELITSGSGEWPDKLEWGWLQNRHIIRLLINVADLFWQKGENDLALDIFSNLLKTNPSDNGGVRYMIQAILEGMTEKEFYNKFDRGGYWDDEINDWFEEKHKEYPNYFKEWAKEFHNRM